MTTEPKPAAGGEAPPEDRRRFLESLDRINRALVAADDVEQAMADVLDLLLDVFDCDRAWLGHNREPGSPSWVASIERTRAGFPGAVERGLEVELDEEVSGVVAALMGADGPVTFGPGASHRVPELLARVFGVRSFIGMALHPKRGGPWMFGLHQCSRVREWTVEDRRLLQEVGRRLADALSSFVLLQGLRESEAKLEEAQRLARLGYWERDLHSGRFALSTETRRIFGVAPDEIAEDAESWRSGWRSRVLPEDLAGAEHAVREALAGTLRLDVEYRIVRPDGEQRWVHSQADVLRDGTGRPLRMFGTVQDVTDRKRDQEALALFRALVDRTSDSIEIIDLETGRFLDVNDRACRVHGYSREEFLRLHLGDIDPRVGESPWEDQRERLRHAGSKIFESTHRRKDGTTFPVEVNLSRARLDREYVLAIVRDVTEQKRLEDQFRQAQKMEAIGRLAGGVAHDFNNLLTVINGYSGLVAGRLAVDDPALELLAEIQKAGDRATSLTRQLLAFSRKQMLQPRTVDVSQLLEELGRLIGRLIGEDIEVEIRTGEPVSLALVDPGQLEQAVINLAVNARDAMPGGGRLSIEASEVDLDAGYAARHPDAGAGRFVRLTVRDTGTGMDEATRARLFEPFFTTKEPGKGTGLGLAMVYGFVRQSGGHVEVESEPGSGTRFHLFLPLAESSQPAGGAEASPSPRGGSETVLLVEDEAAVRALARIALQSYGYTVVEARDGQEAIWLAAQHGGPIHLLVSDVVMPRLSGPRLAELLRRARPALRVLLISGYPGEVADSATDWRGAAFLQKPFRPVELARRVRELLDAPAAGG